MRRSRIAGVILLSSVCGCGTSNTGYGNNGNRRAFDAGSDSAASPDAARKPETFSALYDEIFSQRGCPGCHSSTLHSSKLSWASRDDAYSGLVEQKAAGSACGSSGAVRVVPGNAHKSLLIWKLEGVDDEGDSVCGSHMPMGLSPLSQTDIDRIRAWIDAGAQSN